MAKVPEGDWAAYKLEGYEAYQQMLYSHLARLYEIEPLLLDAAHQAMLHTVAEYCELQFAARLDEEYASVKARASVAVRHLALEVFGLTQDILN